MPSWGLPHTKSVIRLWLLHSCEIFGLKIIENTFKEQRFAFVYQQQLKQERIALSMQSD